MFYNVSKYTLGALQTRDRSWTRMQGTSSGHEREGHCEPECEGA
jgi:hypothetical protein